MAKILAESRHYVFRRPPSHIISQAGVLKRQAKQDLENVHGCPKTRNQSRRVARRDREFGVNDGNMVLIARDLGFPIYRGLLATQPTIFAYTFDSPNSNADGCCDDCPVVRLLDYLEDLRYFLRVLVQCSHRLYVPLRTNYRQVSQRRPRFYQDNTEPSVTFDEISVVIRPSHKYHVADAQRQALSTFKLYFTDDFDDLQTFNEDGLFLKPSGAIAAVNLSRLTDTTFILPLAFNICAALGLDLVRGFVRADRSVERLSADDLRLCLEKARLAAENAHAAFPRPAVPAWRGRSACTRRRTRRRTRCARDGRVICRCAIGRYGGRYGRGCRSSWGLRSRTGIRERGQLFLNGAPQETATYMRLET